MDGQIPAITYGGPEVPGDQPSKESFKLAESFVIVEFISDLHPEAGLEPKDPILRAKLRFFVSKIDTHFYPAFGGRFVTKPAAVSAEDFTKVLEYIQGLLPESGFIAGEWSIGDIAAAGPLTLFHAALHHNVGFLTSEEFAQTLEVYNSPKLARLRKYVDDILARPTFKAIFDEVRIQSRYFMSVSHDVCRRRNSSRTP